MGYYIHSKLNSENELICFKTFQEFMKWDSEYFPSVWYSWVENGETDASEVKEYFDNLCERRGNEVQLIMKSDVSSIGAVLLFLTRIVEDQDTLFIS